MAKNNTPKAPGEQEVVNDGTGRSVLPSDVDGVAYQYGVTRDEAARLLEEHGANFDDSTMRAAADEVRGSRTVYKQGYVRDAAGVSVPQGLSDQAAIPTPPPAPTPEQLDPTAPGPDEPTGAVIDGEIETNDTAAETAEQYAEGAQETADAAQEAASQEG